jgi:hypothetical protein
MQEPLLEFFRSAKAHGASEGALIDLFKRQGWSERQIFSALQVYYEEQTGLKLPQRPSSWESARDAFVYMLSFIALGAWVWSLGSLWFTLIEVKFPDPLESDAYLSVRYTLASALSGLIVGLPVYLFCLGVLSREVSTNPDKLDSGIRKWLTYMAMLIAAGVILGDLINFLNHFLRGELTTRFVLKSLVVFLLAGCVLWYHLGAVGRRVDIGRLAVRDLAYAGTLIAAALVSAVAGFWNLGSPATSRLIEADSQRSADLTRIALSLGRAWRDKKQLPASLDDLAPSMRIQDPITRQPYEYRVTAEPSYELCAEFAIESPISAGRLGRFSAHPKGKHCFPLDASSPQW